MFAKATLLIAMLAVVAQPLAAEPDTGHRCEVTAVDTAERTSASICVPLDAQASGAIFLNGGHGPLGDIMGGRNDRSRDLERLSYYAASGNWAHVEILSRQLAEFGVTAEALQAAVTQAGPRRHPSGTILPNEVSAKAGGS